MMSLVSKVIGLVSPKIQWGLIIVLTTLLTVSQVSNKSKSNDIIQLTELANKSVEQNKRLNDELIGLRKEIRERPKQFIETTKEVMVEICEGKIVESKIKNIPSKNREGEHAETKHTADIDDRLPSELIRLLK